MRSARLGGVAHYLPANHLGYEELAAEHPDWDVAKLSRTLGIKQLPRAGEGEFASHLASLAAENLFDAYGLDRSTVDFVILVTQNPDFPLPTTSCLVQDALGLSRSVGALDVRLGCSGYVYALGLAKGLIESAQATRILLMTADTMSKMVNRDDKATAPVFGDAGTATLVEADPDARPGIGPLIYGTDGKGAGALVVPNGSLRPGTSLNSASSTESRGLHPQGYDLYMDGGAVFGFTLDVVPPLVQSTLARSGWEKDDVDLFVFHQANRFMIEHLRKRLHIPEERFWVNMEAVGNTGGSSIPLALSQAVQAGRLAQGDRVVLAGFGVGLSWAGAALTW